MAESYTASDIEVLSGLDPVRRRPGMYTDTTRPNHLAHEVIDNSVDEAIAGYCKNIGLTLYKDNSLEVVDDGRGMPVDIHPKEKVSGVELILTRLHAGGKFSEGSYKFSGGLHGVGVSVVNALSKHLECWVRRGGKEYNIGFRDGRVHSKLEVIGSVGQRNTGTTVRFWPDPKFFDSDRFSVPDLKRVLKAKAVLCPGLRVSFHNQQTGEKDEWFYTGDLGAYLLEQLGKAERLPPEPITGKHVSDEDAVEWALAWSSDAAELVAESYVNLIPTTGGGTHVNGLRAGVVDAVREFCEFRNLLAARHQAHGRGHLGPGLLRAVDQDPRSAVRGPDQGEARLARGRGAGGDARARRHGAVAQPASRRRRAHRAVRDRECAGAHRAAARVVRKRAVNGPALPGKLADCSSPGSGALGAVPGRGRFGRRLGQAGARPRIPGHHAAARQDPEHLGARARRDRQLAGSA